VVAGELGYGNRTKGALRIQGLIESKNLGANQPGFDFKYSNKELLLKLCDLVGIDRAYCEENIYLVNAEHLIEDRRFKPTIFIATGFKRQNEPIIALAMMESSRYIRISDEIGKLSLRQQLPHVKELVISHYNRPHGEEKLIGALPLWGKIQSYIYHYNEFTVFELNHDGVVVGSLAKHDHPRATMSVKGREISISATSESQEVQDAVLAS